MRRACDRCMGTDAATACAQGQCMSEMEERDRADEERRRWEEAEMARHYSANPHG